MNKQEEIRERLERYIRDLGVSQKFICNQLNMHQPVLSSYKRGKIDLSLDQLSALERYLNERDPKWIQN
ncbi:helix-turn-helix transcriptional regulator [Desulfitobacterium sp. PCE1]|uniref:helix-turn-helix domain-containing protein n=1 Tax=Desulfitobacterium sp. PCE1 TaxID=146907 RepID=UPI000382CF80|nr:helix-turn-helix transcriptional regulator [Desulfitobacterium sp. PCE1]